MQNGGRRPGAGRKLGQKTVKGLEREAELRAFKERVMKSTAVLYASQLHLARGQAFLYKIEKEVIIGPKGGKTIKNKPPKQVTHQLEIEEYLQRVSMDMNGEPARIGDEDTYYFITTKEPSNMAIDSLLDRTYGKSVQSVEMSGPGGKQLFGNDEQTKSKQAISEYLGTDIGEGGQKRN